MTWGLFMYKGWHCLSSSWAMGLVRPCMGEAFCPPYLTFYWKKSLQIYPCLKYCNFRKEKNKTQKFLFILHRTRMKRGFLGDFPPSQQPKCTVSYKVFLGRTPREARAWEAGKEPEAASQKGRSLVRSGICRGGRRSRRQLASLQPHLRNASFVTH